MICPKCGAEGAKRNGMQRGMCFAGRHTFQITPEMSESEASEIREVRHGIAPAHGLTVPMPAGYLMGKVTVQAANGNVERTWTRMSPDSEAQLAAMEAAVAAFAEKLPREKPRPAPAHTAADLLNCYVLTDYHLGMLAWAEETGADWDTAIAETLLVDWFAAAIAQSPPARRAVFAQLGDFLHWDGMDAVTPASKHLLDADTRFQKLVRVAIRAIRRVIGMLLEKHEHVHVLMAEGNHDPASSIWLREWLSAVFEAEPRITVDVSPDPYYCVEHGATALFFHHGHKRKPSNVDAVFAAKFRDVFGRTQHAYAHMGHMHHIEMKETPLMVVEQHRTLAAPDAYASRGGWVSGREAQVITYHARYGEVGRVRVSSRMAEARACEQTKKPRPTKKKATKRTSRSRARSRKAAA